MTISLAIVTVGNLKRTISILLPYITLILLFGAFIVYNGGVVLGKLLAFLMLNHESTTDHHDQATNPTT